jgi:sulfite reductase alpha subunit-like flavoprotein
MALFDKLSQSLEIENITKPEIVTEPEVAKPVEALTQNIDDDYQVTRNNLLTLANKLNDLIDSSIAIAEASETPRAYEVAGKLFDSATAINLAVTKLNQETKKLKGITDKAVVNNNAIFVGSTTQLLKHLNKIN